MSLVTLADYKTALKIGDATEDAKLSQYSLEIDARIKAYLGYDIEQTVYTDQTYDGTGDHYLYPRHVPVTTFTKLEVYEGLNDDDSEDWEEWTVADGDFDRIVIINGYILFMSVVVFPEGIQNIRLAYTAGYTSSTLPDDIQGVCKELMILKYKGIDKGNLGQPSLSLGMGSNATVSIDLDEDKILKKIEHYRIVRV